MEELKKKHKEYYWLYGKSPFKEDEKKSIEDNDGKKLGLGLQLKCQISDCKEKAMALTRFCHKHILNDSNQILYRGCNFPIKRLVLLFLYLTILCVYIFFIFLNAIFL